MRKLTSIIAIATSMLATDVVNAQSDQKRYQQNPFTLVYEGAIAQNEKGKVNIHPVTYQLKGITIAANVYTPAGYEAKKKYPAVVVAHPNGGIKEQTAGLYAQRLAEQGYIAIAADAAYQGASGGEPRHTDKPASRVEDIHGMADFITKYAGVDANRLGVLGICGGGGYTLKATQSDKRFKAVATLSMFNSGEVRRNGFQNSQLNTIQERLAKATEARMQEAAGGFTFPEGEVPEGNRGGKGIPLEDFKKLTKIPIVVYYGDFIPKDESNAASLNFWRNVLATAKQWAKVVNAHGGDATVVHLPEIGLKGNTHFPMSDLNNQEVAEVLAKWLKQKGLDR